MSWRMRDGAQLPTLSSTAPLCPAYLSLASTAAPPVTALGAAAGAAWAPAAAAAAVVTVVVALVVAVAAAAAGAGAGAGAAASAAAAVAAGGWPFPPGASLLAAGGASAAGALASTEEVACSNGSAWLVGLCTDSVCMEGAGSSTSRSRKAHVFATKYLAALFFRGLNPKRRT